MNILHLERNYIREQIKEYNYEPILTKRYELIEYIILGISLTLMILDIRNG